MGGLHYGPLPEDTGWPVKHCSVFLVPLYSVSYTLNVYTGQVTFFKVPENTAMFNLSPCIYGKLSTGPLLYKVSMCRWVIWNFVRLSIGYQWLLMVILILTLSAHNIDQETTYLLLRPLFILKLLPFYNA